MLTYELTNLPVYAQTFIAQSEKLLCSLFISTHVLCYQPPGHSSFHIAIIFQIHDCQDFASVLVKDDNRLSTNSPDIIKNSKTSLSHKTVGPVHLYSARNLQVAWSFLSVESYKHQQTPINNRGCIRKLLILTSIQCLQATDPIPCPIHPGH